MSNFRRATTTGATYFFTVVTSKRQRIFDSEENVAVLREAFRKAREQRPFNITAAVVLPDHLHCLMRLPAGDANFPARWREIKKAVTIAVAGKVHGEIWQRRYWEHLIRDENDYHRHLDYIHYNPVKHGLVAAPRLWRWTSFHQWVDSGFYDLDWGATKPACLPYMGLCAMIP